MRVDELRDAVAARLAVVRGRIADAGGDPDTVAVVAVTKGFGPEAPTAALAAGLHRIGESYAQELVAKWPEVVVPEGVEPDVHFIGRLQRNKVRTVAGLVGTYQSVDRRSLGAEIAKRCVGARVMVQVNVSGEGLQGGCPLGEVDGLVGELDDMGLDVVGLMAIGGQDRPEVVRAQFDDVRRVADRLSLPERSLGMSDDLDVAVAAGSTMVRIGTALFGPRPVGGGVPGTAGGVR